MALVTVEDQTWHTHTTGTNRALKYSLYYDDTFDGTQPVLLVISIWNNGGKVDGTVWDFQSFIDAGYAVINTTYRGALSTSDDEPFPAGVLDVKAFIAWLKRREASPFSLFDLTKIAIMGGSAGSLTAAVVSYSWGALEFIDEFGIPANSSFARTNSQVQGFINIYGSLAISEYDRPITYDQNDNILELLNKASWDDVTDQDMRTIDARKWRSSHLPPCLTIHATDDETNPISQAYLWGGHCNNLGITHTLNTYTPAAGETIGHSVENLQDAGAWTDIISWLDDLFA